MASSSREGLKGSLKEMRAHVKVASGAQAGSCYAASRAAAASSGSAAGWFSGAAGLHALAALTAPCLAPAACARAAEEIESQIGELQQRLSESGLSLSEQAKVQQQIGALSKSRDSIAALKAKVGGWRGGGV